MGQRIQDRVVVKEGKSVPQGSDGQRPSRHSRPINLSVTPGSGMAQGKSAGAPRTGKKVSQGPNTLSTPLTKGGSSK